MDEFLDAVRELNVLHTWQTQAVIVGGPDSAPLGLLILKAQERKDTIKYALIAHVESHRCEEICTPGESKEKELPASG